jgi:peptidoglycan hydrolase-like protein with peptidoglycan-binding domain
MNARFSRCGAAAVALALPLLLGAATPAMAQDTTAAAPSAQPHSTDVGAADWWTCNYYYGNAEIRRGDGDRNGKGDMVREAQCLLRDLYGYYIGPSGIDGDFGGNTERAVRAFQNDSYARNCRIKLLVDGKVGAHTWAALRSGTGCE